MKKVLLAAIIACSSSVFAQELSVDWEWKVAHRCNSTSPAVTVKGIPAGTASLSFQMNDLDFQNKDHGGGSVQHAGSTDVAIPEGALKANYLGPCPNNFSSFGHDYAIAVKALGADGAVLASGSNKKTFSAKTAK